MGSIHIKEISRILKERGDLPFPVVEIRFDKPDDPSWSEGPADEEMVNKVITAESPYGSVVIVFDELGLLKSLDIS